MDALAVDQMLPEWQEKREEAAEEISRYKSDHNTVPEDDNSTPSTSSSSASTTSSSHFAFSSDTTVPVSDEERDIADSGSAQRPVTNAPASQSSSTSSSEYKSSSNDSASLYQPGFMAPTISYDRQNSEQKLIAIVGREFDQPSEIAAKLQKLVPNQTTCDAPVAKFVSFTVKRKMLLKGSFESRELKQHDLICMCYNASEARILLTGTDGFYTSLLRHVEALLGPNKASFVVTNYTPTIPEVTSPETTLISQALKTRLYNQEPLRQYLDKSQVLSWSDEPKQLHVSKLIELANLELNPQSIFANPNCCLL